ncbi:tetratricopeptide repeat protein [Tahibacter soli]|uniref:Tetratricopeptide repeat protein n=1 Tax=Tahibacter soli TaxID=2983605 RepID=A0A9X3YIW6_9GAMM|nr:tetratricopeptide repeat protein [Tahibacter soli]MDC8012025.1 tetratricopeptide repeat protein [Tahibacter soli]
MNVFALSIRSAGVASLLALAACGGAPSPQQAPAQAKVERDYIMEIRAAGYASTSAVEVQPLRDPAVDGFLKQAADLEAQHKYADATATVDRALKLAPDAPEILQLKAELMMPQGKYADAEALARKSYDLGPKLGSLCARNWQTVIETRRVARDDASVESAKGQLASCRVAPRQRL